MIQTSNLRSQPTARKTAIKILDRFEKSSSYIDRLLNSEYGNVNLTSADKALSTEIVYGVIRNRSLLDWVISSFYRGKYSSCEISLKNAMRIALYQIMFLDRIPGSAAVNESVEFVKQKSGIPTSRVANGVLRNILRHTNEIQYPDKSEDLIKYLSVMYSHPQWLVKRFIEIFGEENAEKLLKKNNEIPSTSIRVNTLKSSLQDIDSYLQDHQIDFANSTLAENSILINDRNFRIASSEIFKEGKITIQDISATMVATLAVATAKRQMRILDLCAAPGGKIFFIAEQTGDNSEITAIDKFPAKLRAMQKETDRLGYRSIKLMQGDATTFTSSEQYDIVLCDVPCSGLGVIAKKPDIKWQRSPDEIGEMLTLQSAILNNAATLVKPGGVIIYSTCTIEPQENYENVFAFLATHGNFEIKPAENYLPKEVCKDGMMQTFPQIHCTDGAFAVALRKKQEA